MIHVVNVEGDHFGEREAAALIVDSGALECCVGERSEDLAGVEPVESEEVADKHDVEALVESVGERGFVVGDQEGHVLGCDALHAVARGEVAIEHVDDQLPHRPSVRYRAGIELSV